MRISDVFRRQPQRYGVDDYAGWVDLALASYWSQGIPYGGVQQTIAGQPTEPVGSDFPALATLFESSPAVFACMMVRASVFAGIKFTWQLLSTSELFGNTDLASVERPWPGGTTQDLLTRLIFDADLAGNAYWIRYGSDFVRLRPDWVQIVLQQRMLRGGHLGYRRIGYVYTEGGVNSGTDPVALTLDEVAHYAPQPDPLASYRGMSWLTPVIREIQADGLMTTHKRRYFDNGAPQPLDASILTATGWKTMGEMAPGERVIGSDGKPHEVLAVYPQGRRQVYRVRFSDGSTVRCTGDHLWTVTVNKGTVSEREETLATDQMVRQGLRYPSGPTRFAVPYVDPVQYDDNGPLPADPYLLGLLLGDGYICEHSVGLAAHTDDADETQRTLAPVLPDGVRMVRRDRGGKSTEFNFSGTGRINRLTSGMRELGLAGLRGRHKAVPEAYLRASVTARLAMLQGLMDSDGCAEATGNRFVSTSEQLALNVADLALGLGGRAAVRLNSRGQWVTHISRFPEWVVPFRLSRKVAAYRPASRVARYRHIVDVVADTVEPTQCIAVDTADCLYVTDGYVLTHNTPNMVVKFDPMVSPDKAERFKAMLESENVGVDNAYKRLYLGGGADATVVGNSLQQIDFKTVQGHGETRIAAAAGVPPIIAGFSEGLESATYSNYAQARRRFADGTMHPLWMNAAGSLQQILTPPGGSRLWYDTKDVPFLREDEKDSADIAAVEAQTMRQLIDAGFTADSVVSFIRSHDHRVLQHSGLFSVQLQPAGQPMTNQAAQIMSDQGGSNAA